MKIKIEAETEYDVKSLVVKVNYMNGSSDKQTMEVESNDLLPLKKSHKKSKSEEPPDEEFSNINV